MTACLDLSNVCFIKLINSSKTHKYFNNFVKLGWVLSTAVIVKYVNIPIF